MLIAGFAWSMLCWMLALLRNDERIYLQQVLAVALGEDAQQQEQQSSLSYCLSISIKVQYHSIHNVNFL